MGLLLGNGVGGLIGGLRLETCLETASLFCLDAIYPYGSHCVRLSDTSTFHNVVTLLFISCLAALLTLNCETLCS